MFIQQPQNYNYGYNNYQQASKFNNPLQNYHSFYNNQNNYYNNRNMNMNVNINRNINNNEFRLNNNKIHKQNYRQD